MDEIFYAGELVKLSEHHHRYCIMMSRSDKYIDAKFMTQESIGVIIKMLDDNLTVRIICEGIICDVPLDCLTHLI